MINLEALTKVAVEKALRMNFIVAVASVSDRLDKAKGYAWDVNPARIRQKLALAQESLYEALEYVDALDKHLAVDPVLDEFKL